MAIRAEIIPDLHDLTDQDVITVNDALANCCGKLNHDYSWVHSTCSEVQTFCCSFITSCCSSVKPVTDNLDWIPKHLRLIHQLTKLWRLVSLQNIELQTVHNPSFKE